jgi:hypothetical protein
MAGGVLRRIRGYLLPLIPSRSEAWDRAAGVETRQVAEPSALTVDAGSIEEGFTYVATPPRLVRAWLDALNVPLPLFTLVDLGSGRGRVLLMASERPFRRVLGVEFAAELHASALDNIRRFPRGRMRCTNVSSIYADAASFVFPLDPLVIYLNNPFSEQVMTSVLRNLGSSYEYEPRPIMVVYQQRVLEEPHHSTNNLALLDQEPFLTGRTLRFSIRDRLFLQPFLVRIYASPEARHLSGS